MNMKTKKNRLRLTLFLILVVSINVIVYLLPYRAMHPDVSGNGVYTLSNSSQALIDRLDRDVEITYRASAPDADLRSFLSLYSSSHIKVTVSEPQTSAEDQTIVVRCGDRARTLDLSELFYYASDATLELLSLTEYAQISSLLSQMDSSNEYYQTLLSSYGPDVMRSYFAGDAVVSAAVRNLTSDDLQLLYVLTGEIGNAPDWYLSLRLAQYGFEQVAVDSLAELPDGALVWLAPKADLDETQAAALSDLLSRGGRLLLSTDYQTTDLPRLAEILATYGLSAPTVPNLVVDVVSSSSSSSMSQIFYATKNTSHAVHAAFSGSVIVNCAHKITVTEIDGVKNATLLRTSSSGGYTEQNGEDTTSESGNTYTIAATAVKGDSRVVWLGLQFSALLDHYSDGTDSEYLSACLAWLAEAESASSSIGQTREIPSALLNVKVSTFSIWIVIFVVLIPLALLAVALILRYARKKKE